MKQVLESYIILKESNDHQAMFNFLPVNLFIIVGLKKATGISTIKNNDKITIIDVQLFICIYFTDLRKMGITKFFYSELIRLS